MRYIEWSFDKKDLIRIRAQDTPLNIIRINLSDKGGKAIYKKPSWLIMVSNWPIDWFICRYWYFSCARFGKQRLLMSVF